MANVGRGLLAILAVVGILMSHLPPTARAACTDTGTIAVTCKSAVFSFQPSGAPTTVAMSNFVSTATCNDGAPITGIEYTPTSLSVSCAGLTGLTTASISVDDGAGGASAGTCTFTYEITDESLPSATPVDVILDVGSADTGTVTLGEVTAAVSDTCAGISTASIGFNTVGGSETLTFSCADVGSPATPTVHIPDNSGNVLIITPTITVVDNTDPVIVCSSGFTAELDNSGNVNVLPSSLAVSFSDVCGLAGGPSFTAAAGAYSCADVAAGSFPVYIEVADNSGNAAQCSSPVTIVDTVPPTVNTQDLTRFLDASGMAVVTIGDIDNGSQDNCNHALSFDSTAVVTSAPFICGDTGPNTLTLWAIDPSMNKASSAGMIHVMDTLNPTVLCKDATLVADGSCAVSWTRGVIYSTATDNCAGTMTAVTGATSAMGVGGHTGSLIATDASGNTDTCSSTITIEDNTAPSLTLKNPTGFMIEVDGAGHTASYTRSEFVSTAADNCATSFSYTTTSIDFTCAHIVVGTFMISVTTDDGEGQSTTSMATYNVVDKVDPSITCTSGVTLDVTTSGVVTYDRDDVVTTKADCQLNTYSLTSTLSFSCADVGTDTAAAKALDDSGNSNTCTAPITIQDTIPPTITCTTAVTLDLLGGATQAVLNSLDVVSDFTDNCGITTGGGPALFGNTNGVFPCSSVGVGGISRTYQIMDPSGNTDRCTVMVTVQDPSPPSAVCKNPTLNLDTTGNVGFSESDIYSSATTDNCGISAAATTFAPTTGVSFTCGNVGANAVQMSIADVSANGDMCSAVVTVQDTINPTANCVSALSVTLTGSQASIFAGDLDSLSTDNCKIASRTVSDTLVGCAQVTTGITVTLAVEDPSGNMDTCSVPVTVVDDASPTANCIASANFELDAAGSYLLTTGDIDNMSDDNCGAPMLSLAQATVACIADNLLAGAFTATLAVSDAAGNSASCTSSITFTDTIPPTTNCVSTSVTLDSAGSATITVGDVIGTSADPCGLSTADSTLSTTTFTCGDIATAGTSLKLFDTSGNSATCSAMVTVQDTMAPTVVARTGVVLSLTDPVGPSSLTVTVGDLYSTATDNCDTTVGVTSSMLAFSCADLGPATSGLTATDDYGNSAATTAMLMVTDAAAPVSSCPVATVAISLSANSLAPTVIPHGSFVDNCYSSGDLTYSTPDVACADWMTSTMATTTVTDPAANMNACTFPITITDNTPPSLTCTDETITKFLYTDYVTLGASGAATVVEDNDCLGATLAISNDRTATSADPFGSDTYEAGTFAITFEATDGSGNTGSCTKSFTYIALQSELPTLVEPAENGIIGLVFDVEYFIPRAAEHRTVILTFASEDVGDNDKTVLRLREPFEQFQPLGHTLTLEGLSLAQSNAEEIDGVITGPDTSPDHVLTDGVYYDITIEYQDQVPRLAAADTHLHVLFDGVRPTVTITSAAANPTPDDIEVTITFSEDVTGFDQTDLVFDATLGTLSSFVQDDSRTWTAVFTRIAGEERLWTLQIGEDAAYDVAGNSNHFGDSIERYWGHCFALDGSKGKWIDNYCACPSGYHPSVLPGADDCLEMTSEFCSGSTGGATPITTTTTSEGNIARWILAHDTQDGVTVTRAQFTAINDLCNYPEMSWKKSFTSSPTCTDVYEFEIEYASLIACGFTRSLIVDSRDKVEASAGKRTMLQGGGDLVVDSYYVYDGSVTLDFERIETLESGMEVVTVYSHTVLLTFQFPALFTFQSTEPLVVSSDHSFDFLLVRQEWDFARSIPTLEFATSVRWPFRIGEIDATTAPDTAAVNIGPDLTVESCDPVTELTSCLQRWEVELAQVEGNDVPCNFGGDYGFVAHFECRGPEGGCPESTSDVSFTLPIDSTDTCSFFSDISEPFTASLDAFPTVDRSDDNVQTSFRLGDVIYFELSVYAPAVWPIESISVKSASSFETDAALPISVVPLDLSNEESRRIDNYEYALTFDVYATNQVFPVDQDQTTAFTISVAVEVTYEDGSKRRDASVGTLQPNVVLAMTWDASGAVAGVDDPVVASSTTPAVSSALMYGGIGVGVIAAIAVVMAVVVRARRPSDRVGKFGGGISSSSTALSSSAYAASSASATGGSTVVTMSSHDGTSSSSGEGATYSGAASSSLGASGDSSYVYYDDDETVAVAPAAPATLAHNNTTNGGGDDDQFVPMAIM